MFKAFPVSLNAFGIAPTVAPKDINLLCPSLTISGTPLFISLIPCVIILLPVLKISKGKAMKLPNGERRSALPALPM